MKGPTRQAPEASLSHAAPSRAADSALRAGAGGATGNQAHLRRLQAKLQVGATNDPFEEEADRAADKVMRAREGAVSRAPAPILSREAAGGAGEAAVGAGGGEAPAIVHEALAGPGTPLDAATRQTMSEGLGHDFSGVRVHTGTLADASARAVGARAYTVGADVVFAEGQHRPGSAEGDRLLAHELAHVAQQGEARVLRRDPPAPDARTPAPAAAPDPAPAPKPDPPGGPDPPLKEAKKEDAKDAVKGGLTTMAGEAGKNQVFLTFAQEMAKRYAEPFWNGASPADKAGMVAGGTLLTGTALGAFLSNGVGRQALSGVNFLAPLSLVPYATLSGFQFDLPKTKGDPLGLHFSFKLDDLLDLAHQKTGVTPSMTASFDMTVNVGADSKVTTPSALVKLGLYPGVTLSGGYGLATDMPKTVSGGPGQPAAPYAAYPQPDQPKPAAGAAVFLSVDLLKAITLPPSIKAVF